MRQDVADVGNAGEVHDHPLEAQAEARVLGAAVAPQVQVPPVVLRIHAQFPDAPLQQVQPLLALGPADDLPDAGHQAVGGGHGLPVVVQAHIEGLNLLGIIGDEDRLAEDLLGEEALVLGLEVAAPVHGVLEFVAGVFQKLHRLGVAHPGKIGGGHVREPLHQALVHKGVEEGHLVGTLLHNGVDDILDHGLGHVHIALEVAEGHLWLNHPELCGMARGVGLLCPEGGAEGVDIAEGHGEGLGIQLAGNRQVGALAEEVLTVVHRAALPPGRVLHVQGGHAEHLPRALAVAGGDDGGVDVDEALVLEEAVDGVGRHTAHPECRGEEVGAGPQMGDGTQILHAVALLLEGILGGGGALHLDGRGLYLQGLLGSGGEDHRAGDHEGRAHVLLGDLLEVLHHAVLKDNLEVLEAGAVVKLNEAEGLHIPDGPGPAADRDGPAAKVVLVGENLRNSRAFQWNFPLSTSL